ncbi:Ligand-binding domain of nuclear hormone receptor [Cooperia oncophora]
MRNEHDDVLTWLVREEMKLGERRRILFCERPVDKVLGQTSNCPYTREDIRPLSFRAFRKSIRTHILLIYEKCVLFHTILDPVYISIQIGYPDRFVMQNGGYVSCVEGCEDGWQGEREISTDVKKSIYLPLLKKIMSEIIPPMLTLELSFEEFVALKAFVSWQGAISNVSVHGRDAMRRQIDAISNSLHLHYQRNNIPAAERMGSIILLLSSIFSTGLDFVEKHRQIEFFDLWHLDSLLLQFLNLDSILAELNGAHS